jgi:hypothetical protein
MLQGEIVFVLTLKYMQCLKKAAAGLLASVEIKFEFPTRPRSPPLAPTKTFSAFEESGGGKVCAAQIFC